eukprot:1450681-Rhodomonas_salina.3
MEHGSDDGNIDENDNNDGDDFDCNDDDDDDANLNAGACNIQLRLTRRSYPRSRNTQRRHSRCVQSLLASSCGGRSFLL